MSDFIEISGASPGSFQWTPVKSKAQMMCVLRGKRPVLRQKLSGILSASCRRPKAGAEWDLARPVPSETDAFGGQWGFALRFSSNCHSLTCLVLPTYSPLIPIICNMQNSLQLLSHLPVVTGDLHLLCYSFAWAISFLRFANAFQFPSKHRQFGVLGK